MSVERTITPRDIKDWVGRTSEAKLTTKQYADLADRFTRCRWKNDPDPPKDSPWLVPEPDDDERWWDIDASVKAAKVLKEAFPKMLVHWKSIQHWPETKDGYEKIKALEDALSAAASIIEWPFGEYTRTRGRKAPKDWHVPSLLIARFLVEALIDGGQADPAISTNSIVGRVVRNAVIRMGYAPSTLDVNTVAMYLSRWDSKYGITPKRIRALRTKQGVAAL